MLKIVCKKNFNIIFPWNRFHGNFREIDFTKNFVKSISRKFWQHFKNIGAWIFVYIPPSSNELVSTLSCFCVWLSFLILAAAFSLASMMSFLSSSVVLSSAKTRSSARQIHSTYLKRHTIINIYLGMRYPKEIESFYSFKTYPFNSFSSFCCSFNCIKPALLSTRSFSLANSLK